MGQTKSIAIYGKSGHGSVLFDIATAMGYDKIIWIDDRVLEGSILLSTYYEQYQHIPIALGIGDNKTRLSVFNTLKKHGVTFATLIHPSAIISPSAIVGEASVVMPFVVVNAHASVGAGVILNTASIVEHDCHINNFAHISPNVALAGNVNIGQQTHIGIGASVIQNITIGAQTTIGAGSVVVNNILDNVVAFGTPCKVIH